VEVTSAIPLLDAETSNGHERKGDYVFDLPQLAATRGAFST
jgi:hypothetical protein